MKIVKNLNTLKDMERKGFIGLHPDTGMKVKALYSNKKFTCYYVEDGLLDFTYKNKRYLTKYVSGCFCPYVFEIEN
jgi:hypothetical protein